MSNTVLRPSAEELVVIRLKWLMFLFTGLLVTATGPLWLPRAPFPAIPWFEYWTTFPRIAGDVSVAGNLLIFLLLQLIKIRRTWLRRCLNGYFATTGVVYLLLDQHRMQPWVCQMLMLSTILTLSDARTGIRCARLLTISIYVHSALSKFDMAFLDSHGQWLLEGLATSIGVSTELWSETTRMVLAGLFPVGELLTALLLLWPRARRIGLWFAIVMHVILLLTLGPLGHGHHYGVLIWNVYFILMDLLIFRRIAPDDDSAVEVNTSPQSHWIPTGPAKLDNSVTQGLTAIFVLLPCLSWWNSWDHWTSWAVYSSRPAIVEVYIPEDDIQRLPTTLQPFVGAPLPLSDMCPVNLDAWSFETQWCPMYPQERYRLAIAFALADRHQIEKMRVIIRSSPNRWTGNRQEKTLEGLPAIRSQMKSFWLNTHARH